MPAEGRVVLVSGGLGFVGSYLVRDLLAAGDRVVTLDVAPLPEPALLSHLLPPSALAQVTMVVGEVGDPLMLARVLGTEQVTHLVHLANLSLPSAQIEREARVNTAALLNVVELADVFGLKRIVYASSAAVFGPSELYATQPIADDAPHYPGSLYGSIKSFNERVLAEYARRRGLDSIALRLNAVYGFRGPVPGRDDHVEALFSRPARGEASLVADADQYLNWQYIDDVTGTVLAALAAPGSCAGRAYNTCGYHHTIREVAAVVAAVRPETRYTFESGYSWQRGRMDDSVVVRDLGYRPRFTLAEGVRHTFQIAANPAGTP